MIRPRRNEVEAIVELLEGESYETAAELAEAILKRTYLLFQEREWFAWIHRDRGLSLFYGPFAGRSEAERFARDMGLGGENYTMKLYSVAALRERQAQVDKPVTGEPTCRCGHNRGLHEHPKTQGRCMYGHQGARKQHVSDCACKAFEEAK